MESLTVLFSNGRVLFLPTNIRQGWKWIEVANALAFYDTAKITAVKSFIVQAPDQLRSHYFTKYGDIRPGDNVIKLFTVVIYKFS